MNELPHSKKPIEEEILAFCREMSRNMRQAQFHHRETGWFANNSLSDGCKAMADAYDTVARHIESETAMRLAISKTSK